MTDLLVFGVDGLNPGVVRDLTTLQSNGSKMRSFSALQDRLGSTFGKFESHIEDGFETPHTGPAWTSMYTGLKPEEHGLTEGGWREGESIFDDLYTIWDALRDSGKTTAMCGMPMTYPAKDIGGFMASGFVASSDQETYVERGTNGIKDEDIAQNLSKVQSTYVAKNLLEHGAHHDTNTELAFNILSESEEKRLQYFCEICSKKGVEYDIVAYGTTFADKMGHINGIEHDDEYTEKTYEKVDDMLSTLITVFDPDDVIIVSDHGFLGMSHTLYGYYLSTFGHMESIFDFVDHIEDNLDVQPERQYGRLQNESSMTEDEKEQVKDRLDDLGYFG